MAPRPPPTRTTAILVRLSELERDRFRAASAAAGLGVAPWIRSVSLAAAPASLEPAADPDLQRGEVVTPQTPTGEPITYRVVEARELVPSHDPWSFTPSPGYPRGVQEREYHRQQEEQAKVIQGAARLDPRLVLTDTPSAVDGPPLVTGSWAHDGAPLVTGGDDRIVLGGNGRSMMILRAFKDPARREAYRAALVRKAPGFGHSRPEIRGMKAPVLVRVVHGLTSRSPRRELVSAVRRFNEGLTQALSARARAVAEASTLSPEALAAIGELLAAAPDATLRDVMRDRGRELAGVLRRDGVITTRNSSELLTAAGELTDTARDRIERMFLGVVLGSADRYAATPPALLAKLERIVGPVVRVRSLNPSADVTPDLQGAIDAIADARRRGLALGDLAAQTSMLADVVPPSPAALELARVLEAEGPVKIAGRFRRWADAAAFDPRQATMFGAPSPAELRALLTG